MIDVGRPEVEGEDGEFVVEAAAGHREAGGRQRRGREERGEFLHHAGQRGRAGEAVEIAQAEEHDAVGGDAEHHVLDGRLHLEAEARALAAHRHHQVERERRELQGDDHRKRIDAAHEGDEADGAECQEEEVLGLDAGADVGEIGAEQRDSDEAAEEHDLQQLGKRIDAVGAVEEHGVLAEADHGSDGGGEADDQGEPARQRALRFAERHAEEAEGPGEQHELRKKSQ